MRRWLLAIVIGALGGLIAGGIVALVLSSAHQRHNLCTEENKTRGVQRALLLDAKDATLERLTPTKRTAVIADAAREHPSTQAGQNLAFLNRNLARIDALTC